MKANGRMGSNMVSQFTHLPLERLREENGKRERGSLGLIEKYCCCINLNMKGFWGFGEIGRASCRERVYTSV
jgi:hypothetical protein